MFISKKQWLGKSLPLAVIFASILYLLRFISFNLRTQILGRPYDDAFESIWYLYWYKHALFDLRVSPLFQPDIFYPEGWDLSFSVMPPFYPAFFAPLTAVFGPVMAYNLVIIGSCLFAASGMYLLCQSIGVNRWGSIFAGLIFTFYPQREIYLHGHLNFLLASMWLPWIVYGLIQAGRSKTKKTRWMLFVGLTYGLSLVGAWQFVFLSTGLIVVFGSTYLWPSIRVEWRAWLRPLAWMGLTAIIIAAPFYINAQRTVEHTGADPTYSFENIDSTGVSPEWLISPNPLNHTTWYPVQDWLPPFNGGNDVVSLGLIALFLAIFALVMGYPWQREMRSFVVLSAVGIILMLGLTLHFGGKPVTFRVADPAFIQTYLPELLLEDGQARLPMPAYLFYRIFPRANTFHHYSRWGLLASLGVAVLAGLGFTQISQRFDRRKALIAGLLVFGILLFELGFVPIGLTNTADMQRPVDKWLRAQPDQNIIIEYPLKQTMKPNALYFAMQHQQKIVHGSSILPESMSDRLLTLEQFPDKPAMQLLQELGVRYVIVNVYRGDDSFETETLPELLLVEGMELVQKFDTSVAPFKQNYLFELTPTKLDTDERG